MRTANLRLKLLSLLVVVGLALVATARADEFLASEYQRQTIYHSPQKPGFTSWVVLGRCRMAA